MSADDLPNIWYILPWRLCHIHLTFYFSFVGPTNTLYVGVTMTNKGLDIFLIIHLFHVETLFLCNYSILDFKKTFF